MKTAEKDIDYYKLFARLDRDLEILKGRHHIKNSSPLIDRILKTKEDLSLVQQGQSPVNIDTESTIESHYMKTEQFEKLRSIDDLRKSLPILVREDGTVDWDGAWSSSKEVARFGGELWERLNGKAEGIPTVAMALQVNYCLWLISPWN